MRYKINGEEYEISNSDMDILSTKNDGNLADYALKKDIPEEILEIAIKMYQKKDVLCSGCVNLPKNPGMFPCYCCDPGNALFFAKSGNQILQ